MKENIFQQITSDNIAYWIGFLAADGCITKRSLEIGLANKDKEHLEQFIKFLNAENELTILERNTKCSNNNKYYLTDYLFIYNIQIVNDLSQYGIVQRKTYKNIDFLSFIPDQYKIPFILGVFDGDGNFTNTEKTINFGICGNEKNINSILQYLNNYFKWEKPINAYNYTKSPTTFYFQTQDKIKLQNFIDIYLSYADKCDLLQRKYNIALDIKERLQKYVIRSEEKKIQQEEERLAKYTKFCPICKREYYAIHPDQIYCSQKCFKISCQKVERPNREELKNLIKTKSFLEIGRMYNVSDNAIRKWCKAMNLPFKKSEINLYTDQEWSSI